MQEEKLIFHRENISLIRETVEYFEKRMIMGLRFNRFISEASFEQILEFLRLLNNLTAEEESLIWLVSKLKDKAFSWVEIAGVPVESAKGI